MDAGQTCERGELGRGHMGQRDRRGVVAALHHGAGIFVSAPGVVIAHGFAQAGFPRCNGPKGAVLRRWHPEGQKDEGYELANETHGGHTDNKIRLCQIMRDRALI